MMRAVWFTLLVVFLVGCSAAQSPTGQVVASACTPPQYEYTPGDCCLDAQADGICDRDQNATVATAVPAPAAPVDPKMSAIPNAIAKFNQNVSSYSFKIKKDDYFVRGPLIHVQYGTFRELPLKINNTIRVHLTDLYVDRETKEIIGYCDPRGEERIVGEYQADRSKCIKIIDIPIALDYNEYNPELPEDVLTNYAHREPFLVEDTEQFVKEPSGWKAVQPIVHFGDENNEVILRLDAKTGLPLKIETRKGVLTTTQDIEFFVHNRVKPEETVYRPFAR